jgi:hypothetical protein
MNPMTSKQNTAAKESARQERWEIKVYLVISGFEGSPVAISRVLGIQPTRKKLRGEPVSFGELQTKLTRKANFWLLDSGCPTAATLTDQVAAVVRQVEGAAPRFADLPKGTTVTLSCAIYDYSRDVALVFDAPVISALAAIGADLNIDYYDLTEYND